MRTDGIYRTDLGPVKVFNDFLPNNAFKRISSVFLGPDMPWFCQENVAVFENSLNVKEGKEELLNYNMFFSHVLYVNGRPNSALYEEIVPILEQMNFPGFFRVTANLTVNSGRQIKHGFHRDLDFHGKTCIYYLNTTNGPTLFDGYPAVESQANRLVVFDSAIAHSGVTPTDTKRKVLINLNAFNPATIDLPEPETSIALY